MFLSKRNESTLEFLPLGSRHNTRERDMKTSISRSLCANGRNGASASRQNRWVFFDGVSLTPWNTPADRGPLASSGAVPGNPLCACNNPALRLGCATVVVAPGRPRVSRASRHLPWKDGKHPGGRVTNQVMRERSTMVASTHRMNGGIIVSALS